MHIVFSVVSSCINYKHLFRKSFKVFTFSIGMFGIERSYTDDISCMGGVFDIEAINYGPSISLLVC
jgi:hypothetical protein